MEGLEEKLNIQHEAVAILSTRGSGEKLPALHDQPEDVVEGLEAFLYRLLSLGVGDHLGTMADTRQETLKSRIN